MVFADLDNEEDGEHPFIKSPVAAFAEGEAAVGSSLWLMRRMATSAAANEKSRYKERLSFT
jgi:hypothetical protein